MSCFFIDLRGKIMKKLFAEAILSLLLLLCTPCLAPMIAHGATAEVACELASGSASCGDEQSEDEEQEVLGEKRDNDSGTFITGVEIAICLIFAVGLVSAGKSGYEK